MKTEGSGEIRAKILEHATNLFLLHGYNGVSMREIAAVCQLSKAGLYYHFKDKQDLFMSILTENLQALHQLVLTAAEQAGTVQERISYFSHGIFRALKANQRGVIRLASQELRNLEPALLAEFNQQYEKLFIKPLAAILQKGMQEDHLKAIPLSTATWSLMGLLYPFLDRPIKIEEIDVIVDDLLTIYFAGLAYPGLPDVSG